MSTFDCSELSSAAPVKKLCSEEHDLNLQDFTLQLSVLFKLPPRERFPLACWKTVPFNPRQRFPELNHQLLESIVRNAVTLSQAVGRKFGLLWRLGPFVGCIGTRYHFGLHRVGAQTSPSAAIMFVLSSNSSPDNPDPLSLQSPSNISDHHSTLPRGKPMNRTIMHACRAPNCNVISRVTAAGRTLQFRHC
jgi:hypothetical protein